jgi:hypothetical protein
MPFIGNRGGAFTDQIVVFPAPGIALVPFSRGVVRHDFAALITLIAGVVPPGEAFPAFGHPAMVTVISILIIGKAPRNPGFIKVMTHRVTRFGNPIKIRLSIVFGNHQRSNQGAKRAFPFSELSPSHWNHIRLT